MAVTVLEPMNGKGGGSRRWGESAWSGDHLAFGVQPAPLPSSQSILHELLVSFRCRGRAMVAFNGFSGLYCLFPCPEDGILLFSVCASRCDEQVQSFAVKEFLYVFSRFRGMDAVSVRGMG